MSTVSLPPASGKLVRAMQLARQHDAAYMVASIDHEDTRAVRVFPLSYADEDEFLAFDGLILAIAYPDGSFER